MTSAGSRALVACVVLAGCRGNGASDGGAPDAAAVIDCPLFRDIYLLVGGAKVGDPDSLARVRCGSLAIEARQAVGGDRSEAIALPPGAHFAVLAYTGSSDAQLARFDAGTLAPLGAPLPLPNRQQFHVTSTSHLLAVSTDAPEQVGLLDAPPGTLHGNETLRWLDATGTETDVAVPDTLGDFRVVALGMPPALTIVGVNGALELFRLPLQKGAQPATVAALGKLPVAGVADVGARRGIVVDGARGIAYVVTRNGARYTVPLDGTMPSGQLLSIGDAGRTAFVTGVVAGDGAPRYYAVLVGRAGGNDSIYLYDADWQEVGSVPINGLTDLLLASANGRAELVLLDAGGRLTRYAVPGGDLLARAAQPIAGALRLAGVK